MLDGKEEDEQTKLFDQVPKYIRVNFWEDRTCCNKFLFAVYKVFRIFYVTFWFYFMPFSVIFFCMFEGDVSQRY